MLDERTEQLIARRLDGQLSDDDSLELDKLLIRSPEARVVFEESRHIDELAAQTLHTLLDGKPHGHAQPTSGITALASARKARRLLDGAIGVAAAVLLVMVGTSLWPQGEQKEQKQNTSPQIAQIAPVSPGPSAVIPDVAYSNLQSDGLTEVIAGPRQAHEHIDQNVIGVVDPETQSIYLLEIETARNTVSSLRANF